MRNGIFIAVAVTLTTLLWPRDAHANYIDPATGGFLLQIIFGGLAGLAVFWKIFQHRISSIFSPFMFVRRLLHLPSRKVESTDTGSSQTGETEATNSPDRG